jgi:hypothetical protein
MSVCPPLKELYSVNKTFDFVWPQVEKFIANMDSLIPKWPAWCFLPVNYWYKILHDNLKSHGIAIDVIFADINSEEHRTFVASLAHLMAIGTWRFTQGIYRIDPDVLKQLVDTDINGEIPVDVFLRLPEFCLYIETPGLYWRGEELLGFWVYLDWTPASDIPGGSEDLKELCFLLNLDNRQIPIDFNLGPWTVLEAIAKQYEEMSCEQNYSVLEKASLVQPLLSIVLYLCSDEPDIAGPNGSSPIRYCPKLKKVKKGLRLFPPDKPTIFEVGSTIGRVLRKEGITRTGLIGARKTLSPHIRRAHWHGYWIGPSNQKKYSYRWIAPIVVGRSSLQTDF